MTEFRSLLARRVRVGQSAATSVVAHPAKLPASSHPGVARPGPRRAGWLVLSAAMLMLGCSAAGSGDAGTVGAAGGGGAGGSGGDSSISAVTGTKGCTTLLAKHKQRRLKSIDTQAGAGQGVPDLPRPKKGLPAADPAYGNCVVRVTDHAEEKLARFARHDYSRRQAFNADGSRILIGANDGTWHLYDGNTLEYVERLSKPAGDAELQWHPTDPDLLYFMPANGLGMMLYELNVKSGSVREVADFGDRLKKIWPGAAAAWTKAEGAPSADGRYWCFMVDDAEWHSLGVFAWDLK